VLFIGDAHSYHVSKWMRFFGGQGREVHVLSTGAAEIPGVHVHHIPNPLAGTALRHLYYPWYAFSGWRLMRRVRPDVVHVMQINLFAFLAMLAGARPAIVTPFGGDVLVRPKESKFSAWLVRFVLRRCARVVCDAEHVIPTLRSLGAEDKQVDIVYFGVDMQRFNPAPPSPAWIAKLDLDASAPVIISLRHLLPIYDIHTYLRAVPLVLASFPRAQFIVVGRGTEEASLRALASELGIEASLRWVSWVDGAELPGLLSTAWIYVSTSLSDAGLASSTGEAMACGVVPIVTDFGDNSDWVQPGVTGILFPLRDAAALAAAICEVLSNDAERQRLGTNATHLIAKRYNWHLEMTKMGAIYDEMLRVAD
jgi:glycosyltransferase involved in cell wall biosynthesis